MWGGEKLRAGGRLWPRAQGDGQEPVPNTAPGGRPFRIRRGKRGGWRGITGQTQTALGTPALHDSFRQPF